MARDRYEPIKLNQSNRYAGYQFHARVRVDGMDAADGFRYLILFVYKWIRSRVPEEEQKVPELSLPEMEEYASVSDEDFLPYHFSVGYSLDITPLLKEGIWALRLKEPDKGTDERPAVAQRFFSTRVGLRLSDKGYTELGIRIDVTDPASEEREVDFAFRPGFVRSLAVQPSVIFEHVREMGYGCPLRVSTPEEYKRFQFMLDNEDNQLPLVVFTHYRPGEKKVSSGSMEEFVKSGLAKGGLVESFLQSPGVGFGMPGKKEPVSLKPSVKGMPALKPGVVVTLDKQGREADAAFSMTFASATDASVPAAAPILLYDTEAFARSAFGYARTVVLGDSFFDKFSSRVKKEIRPGDIVLCGARKFRGEVSVAGAFTGTEEEKLKKAYSAALLTAQSYSKHKAPYSFGSVVFEAEARRMEQHARVLEIVNSSTMEEKEKIGQLTYEMELLFGIIDDKDEDIRRLNDQKSEAFDRGVAFRDAEYAALEKENTGLRRDLEDMKQRLDQMLMKCQRADDVLLALEQSRAIEDLPESNEDVVQYFKKVYRDRLGFTERGEAEASGCKLRPAHLWTVLYTVANKMTDVFRNAQDSLTEDMVVQATGFDVSFREGSMTRKDNEMMRLRDDLYNGKKISVEPHVKLKFAKGDEAAHQRLHFCYDPEQKKIIIGYLGDHLDSAASRYVKKR